MAYSSTARPQKVAAGSCDVGEAAVPGRVLKEATWIFELAGVGIFAVATYVTTQVVMKQAAPCKTLLVSIYR